MAGLRSEAMVSRCFTTVASICPNSWPVSSAWDLRNDWSSGSLRVFLMMKPRSRMGAPEMFLPRTASCCCRSFLISTAISSKNFLPPRLELSTSLRLMGSPCSMNPRSSALTRVMTLRMLRLEVFSSLVAFLTFIGVRLYTMRWGMR